MEWDLLDQIQITIITCLRHLMSLNKLQEGDLKNQTTLSNIFGNPSFINTICSPNYQIQKLVEVGCQVCRIYT